MLATVKHNGVMLSKVAQEFRNNKEIVLAAVRENAEAFKYASNELKDDPEIKKAAANNLKNRFEITGSAEIYLKRL